MGAFFERTGHMPYDGANITALRKALQAHGLSPNKRLGQNFLCDANIADAIVNAAGDLHNATVLEIGPGAGALTVRLLKKAERVLAIELDAGLCRLLEERIEDVNFTLIHADALKIPLEELNLTEHCVLVANLPYYVTTPLLMRYLLECKQTERFVLMMQKEVAQRLCSPPGGKEYGSLSVAVQYYADVKSALTVSANCFYPAPEVSSAVVVLNRKIPPVIPKDEQMLFRVVQACFAMRRKTIQNNLQAIPGLGKQGAEQALAVSGISGSARGETLSLDEFIALSDAVGDILLRKT